MPAQSSRSIGFLMLVGSSLTLCGIKKNCVLPCERHYSPLSSRVPLGVARLSPSSRYRVLHEATVGPACALGVPCPVGKPSS